MRRELDPHPSHGIQLDAQLVDRRDLSEIDARLGGVRAKREVAQRRSTQIEVANAGVDLGVDGELDVGLRLSAIESVASSHNYAERGLVREGDAWQTTNYDAASARIDLRTQANAGSFDLEPEDACDA